MNNNDNTKRLVCGPKNFGLEDHEELEFGPSSFIFIPNLHYVEIQNPIVLKKDGSVALGRFGLAMYQWNKIEVRTRNGFSEPFPLYPEEKLIDNKSKPLKYIENGQALLLKCVISYTEGEVVKKEGDEWLFKGPGHYVPRQEVEIGRTIEMSTIRKNQALKLVADRTLTDCYGIERKAGQSWLIREEGSYLPNVGENSFGLEQAIILDDRSALHIKANADFTDIYQVKRNAGEEWIITSDISTSHILDIHEENMGIEAPIILGEEQYCVIVNPYDKNTRKISLGKFKLMKGVCSFFLNPGESLRENVQYAKILTAEESILIQALEDYTDPISKQTHKAGAKWMISGPIKFIPPVELSILSTSRIIPLDKNEGIYVRNTKTGKVFKHMGSSYYLKPEEVLWEKNLPQEVEKIYLRDLNLTKRDKTRIVSYKCPFNAIMQIYNMKAKSNRIIFGPNLAVLDPDEEFTLIQLSGKCPKESGVVSTLYLQIGPVFSTDEFEVETVDHTKLMLKVSYNWMFDIKPGQEDRALKIFTIRDFIADMCMSNASKMRSFISTLKFEDFHKNSDRFIKKAVFGENEKGEINTSYIYKDSHLTINDVDIKNVIPTDKKTLNLLQESVSLAIQLTTKTIEQEFDIRALIKSQEFKGELEKLKITNEIEYLKKLQELSKLRIDAKIIESNGLSRANALALKEAVSIESKSKVKLAEMEKEAQQIETTFDLKKKKQENEIEYLEKSETQRLEIKQNRQKNSLEADKFKNIVNSIGKETLVEIARAGPELQAKLLSGLNLSGYILTDGNNPINLFNVANNLAKTD
jgi:major vault protein